MATKPEQKQHVDLHRKLALRRRFLAEVGPGVAYVPFVGDGDIAQALYADRPIWAVDCDPARVETARQRLPASAVVVEGNAESYLFADRTEPLAVLDLDAYSDPWPALRAAWASPAVKASPLVLFLTDGRMQRFMQGGHFEGKTYPTTNERRAVYNRYPDQLRATLSALIAPWTITRWEWYVRAKQYYVAVIVQDQAQADADPLPPSSATAHAPLSEAPPANPYKFDQERKEAFLALLRKGGRRCASAHAVGIHPSTVWLVAKTDSAFKRAIALAEMEANEVIENALYESAKNGNVSAQFGWLYSRWPSRWKDARGRVDGTGAVPPASQTIVIPVTVLQQASSDELAVLERLVRRMDGGALLPAPAPSEDPHADGA